MLHGLFATAAAWEPLDAEIATSWPGRRLLLDLPGHGRSTALPDYSFGAIAADVARTIGSECGPVVVVGHSMGAVVALTLASGWFGIPLTRAIALGVKLEWSTEELDAAARARQRPVKWYDSREEAEHRVALLAALPADAMSDADLLARAVQSTEGRFRLAADPRAASIGPPPMASLMAAATVPVRLVCGELDQMVSVEQLRRFDPGAVEIPGCGHGAHVESPSSLVRLITTAAAPAGAS
jgi:pimeloyl-ACP methyl ester carboxylesterase